MSEESLDQRLQSLLKQGRKIEAIKLCKDELKIDVDDARQYIEEMIQQIESVLKSAPESININITPTPTPTNIQATNFEPLKKPIEDLDRNTPNGKSEIFNTQPAKSTTDPEKKDKNGDKISLKTKILAGLVFLVILKGCSYHHYSSGGDNSGSKLSKLLYWIADTVIPWPKTPRPESEAGNEVDSNQTEDIESNAYSQDETTDDTSVSEYTGQYEYKIETYDDAAIYYMAPNIKDFIGTEFQGIFLASAKTDSLIYHVPSGHKVYVIEDLIRNESGAVVHVYCDGYEGMMDESLLKKN